MATLMFHKQATSSKFTSKNESCKVMYGSYRLCPSLHLTACYV